ncbi:MAG: transposase [Chroococcidiopsidaceae cyanobacterium CP_BM_ER_R8_30]|nr:transposase [Chroococcidiopsidaceae cyanobacterium CP_BM_ER_R8_30]
MILGFKTQLKLNSIQLIALAKHAGTSRHAYNWGLGLCQQILEHNKQNPDKKIKFPSAIDLHKWLVAIVKPENPWYYESSKSAPQNALRSLRTAFDRFFAGTSGFPNFKKKFRNDSFTLDGTIKVISQSKIQVPVIGVLKTFEHLPVGYRPKSVMISRQADKWFISYKIEVEESVSTATSAVGVDLGLLRFATLSTGEEIESPRPYKALEKQLAKIQWGNRNKELNSNNYRKAQVKVARLQAQIASVRKDFIHKLTTRLAKNHGQIVIEDLNVKGMIAFGHLAKSVSDSGFYEFRRQLEYKTKLYGSKLVLSDRWFASSKTCNHCSCKKESLSLSERVFTCSECGFEIDRDLNAALNLVRLVQPEFTPTDMKTPKSMAEVGIKTCTNLLG